MFAVCVFRNICPKYSSHARPVLIESRGKEFHDDGVSLGGEGRQVSGWAERALLRVPRKWGGCREGRRE